MIAFSQIHHCIISKQRPNAQSPQKDSSPKKKSKTDAEESCLGGLLKRIKGEQSAKKTPSEVNNNSSFNNDLDNDSSFKILDYTHEPCTLPRQSSVYFEVPEDSVIDPEAVDDNSVVKEPEDRSLEDTVAEHIVWPIVQEICFANIIDPPLMDKAPFETHL